MIRITKLYGRETWYYTYFDADLEAHECRISFDFKSVSQLMNDLAKTKKIAPAIVDMTCEVDIGENDKMFALDHNNDTEVLAFVLRYS